jgi:peptide deformylase
VIRTTDRPEKPHPVQIVHWPHPTLRHKSKPLKRVDAELRAMVQEMFVLMYADKGIGLAANQVDLPYRLFVLNSTGDPEQPEHQRVFINPVTSEPKGMDEAEEGCLSLPGIYGPVKRPETVVITSFDLDGNEQREQLDGLPARVVQHEVDHLDGRMFFDRMTDTALMAVREALDDFETQYQGVCERGGMPSPDEISSRLYELEKART